MKRFFLFLGISLLLTACSAHITQQQERRPNKGRGPAMMGTGFSGGAASYSRDTIGLPEAQRTEVVELNDGDRYTLTASMVKKEIQGQMIKMLAYNGMIPGPMFKVQRGASVTIDFLNQTDEEALLHSHGLRLDNAFDGTVLTQDPIPVGGRFTYELTFPDTGIYWYHPHLREDYTQELGLYGNYLVQSEDPDYWSPVNQDLPLVLDDLLMENGDIAPFYRDLTTHALLGRIGNLFLINGSEEYELNLRKGEVIRFYATNVSNARFYTLAIPGAQIKLVGADASKYLHETFVDRVFLAPSERAVIEVAFPDSGTFQLINDISQGKETLGTFRVSKESVQTSYMAYFEQTRDNDELADEIATYESFFDREPDKRLRMSLQMGMMPENTGMGMGRGMGAGQSAMQTVMNEHSTTDMLTWNLIDMDTGKRNMDIDWTFREGDIIKLRLFNDPRSVHSMQHPIHLHGQRFLVLETNGRRHENLAWKDTFTVLSGDTVDILVDMSNPGTWMLHCHIAEHLEADMMLGFEVLPKDQ